MKKISLYLSAFIPLYFLIVLKILIEIINGNLTFNVLNTMTIILLIALISVGGYGAIISVKHENNQTVEIEIINKKSITEQYFLGYFSLFVLFALTFELERVSMFVVFVLIIILIGIVYIKNDLFYINPFLNILGYNFYDVTYKIGGENINHTSKMFIKGKIEQGEKYKLVKLSEQNFSMIIEKQKNSH